MLTCLPPIPPFAFDVTLPLARMSDQRDVSREYEVQFRVLCTFLSNAQYYVF